MTRSKNKQFLLGVLREKAAAVTDVLNSIMRIKMHIKLVQTNLSCLRKTL